MFEESVYRTEIETLHELFVNWYVGTADAAEFERIEAALAPDFQRVSPEGDRAGRTSVLEGIRKTHDTYEPGAFDIEIRDVAVVDAQPERALVRYEEWQDTPDGTSGRLSTALFAPHRDGPESDPPVEWRYLQETWLEQ